MEKLILKLISIVLVLLSTSLWSQDFQGQAFYQTQRKVDLKMDDSQLSDDQKAQMQKMLKKQFERTYILTFNKEASVYIEEEQLEAPTAKASTGSFKVMSIGGGGAGQKYYKNTKTKNFAQEQDVFGKPFLVKDDLEVYNWELEDESKVIGKYLCFKATAKREVVGYSMSFDSDNNDDENKEPEETTEIQTVTAWYTTDIPVNNGPGDFWGLPGLILELHDGEDMSYVCNKIVMNSKDKIKILAPTKGKVVSSEEFEEIMQKKMKEMQEQYGGRGRKGADGQKFSIQVGG